MFKLLGNCLNNSLNCFKRLKQLFKQFPNSLNNCLNCLEIVLKMFKLFQTFETIV